MVGISIRKAVPIEELFPPTGGSKTRIVGLQDVLFAPPGRQDQGAVATDLGDRPVLVDFVDVIFAVRVGVDSLGAGTGMVGSFDDAEYDTFADSVMVTINQCSAPLDTSQPLFTLSFRHDS